MYFMQEIRSRFKNTGVPLEMDDKLVFTLCLQSEGNIQIINLQALLLWRTAGFDPSTEQTSKCFRGQQALQISGDTCISHQLAKETPSYSCALLHLYLLNQSFFN